MPNCEICNTYSKYPNYFKTKAHRDTKKHKTALKGLTQKKDAGKSQTTTSVTSFDRRVALLENSVVSINRKIDFILDEIAAIQKKVSIENASRSNLISKNLLIDKIEECAYEKSTSDKWITVDTLISSLKPIVSDFSLIQKKLITMFDNGLIELIDGTSSRKVNMRGRKYGLIRLK